MIPAHFIPLPSLPINANGKLDRSKLPEPESDKVQFQDVNHAFTEPRSESERKIAAVWAAVLRLDRVGVDDNFFALGGDSILGIQVVANCRRAGLHNVGARDLFQHPTVAALARYVDGRKQNEIAPVMRSSGVVKLTPIQQWFFEQRLSAPNYWNQTFLFQVAVDLDRRLLGLALEAVCEHHDTFRLSFRQEDELWLASLADKVPSIDIAYHDLSWIDATAQAGRIEKLCAAEQASLDIAQGRLIRAALFHLGGGQPDRLLVAVHHLAIDGVSWRILLEDIEAAYGCLIQNRHLVLPLRTTTFQAWAEQLSAYAQNEQALATAETWQRMLAGPVTALPPAFEDSLEADAEILSVQLSFPETEELLQDVPAAYRTQINDVLLTALAKSLQQVTGGTSFLIEMEGHGREDIGADLDLSRTIGWFTSVFPLRLEVEPGAGMGVSLKSIKEQVRKVPDRGLTYGLLRHGSADPAIRAALSGGERPRLLFNYLGQFDQVTGDSKLFTFAAESTGPWHGAQNLRTHALEVLVQIRDGRLRADWIFSEKQTAPTTIEQLSTNFITALRDIIVHCREQSAGGRTPSDFPLLALSQDQVDQLWQCYPGFVEAYPLTPMQRLFHVMDQTGSSVGLEQWQFRIEGRFYPDLLRAAFEQVLARHSILRSAFVTTEKGEPLQVVLPAATVPWLEEDWRHLDAIASRAALQSQFEQDARNPFDTSRPPLMRVRILRTGDTEWQLLWTTHHLCIDGWSWPRLFMEIVENYAALQESRSAMLESPLGFGRYVAWLSRQNPVPEYWKGALAGFRDPTPVVLGSVAPAPTGSEPVSARQHEHAVHLTTELTRSLRTQALTTEITLSTLVQAAWALLLAHYSDSSDVVFGATLSGRPAELDGIDHLIGPCVTNVPVRAAFADDALLRDWLRRLQVQQLDLNQHQFTPLDAIQAVSEIPWHKRLFDSLIVFQNYQIDEAIGQLGQDARLLLVQAPEATNYALTIAVSPGEELILRLIYNSSRIDQGTVDAVVHDLPILLTALAASTPRTTIADILEQLPAERRGKAASTARAALARRTRTSPSSAPNSEAERRLAEIWSKLLGRSDIGIDDNFFDAGGQSLLLVRMHRLIEDAFGVRLQIVKLLEYPTIRALATNVETKDGAARTTQQGGQAAERALKQRAALAKQRAKVRLS